MNVHFLFHFVRSNNEDLREKMSTTTTACTAVIGDQKGCSTPCRKCRRNVNECNSDPQTCFRQPIIKEYKQGVIMSGEGSPPYTICADETPVATFPTPRCFLYWNWYDRRQDQFYKLRRTTGGTPIGYDRFDDAARTVLPLYQVTTLDNLGAQGSIINSATLLSLTRCRTALAQGSLADAFPDPQSLDLEGAVNANILTGRILQCVANSNRGSLGFIYANPPVPEVVASLTGNQGYSTTPDYWLTPAYCNNYVFVRDTRIPIDQSPYYPDPNNTRAPNDCLPPVNDACDGDIFKDYQELVYEFDATYCRWYLVDYEGEIPDGEWGTDAANQGIVADSFCPVAPNYLDNCVCGCDFDPCRDPAQIG